MKKNPRHRRLRAEQLESRTLLAVTAGAWRGIEPGLPPEPTGTTHWEVNTNDDPNTWNTYDNVISLREALARASSGDLITFTSAVARKTITLHGSPLEIFKAVTISGTSGERVSIDGAGKSCVFYISGGSPSAPVNLTRLAIVGGKGTNGGGISNYGALTVTDCLVSASSASYGGGIYNGGGTLTLSNTTVFDNSAGDQGGGIYNSGTLTVASCDIFQNGANSGGGLYHYSGTATLTNSLLRENNSKYNGGGIYVGGGTMRLTNVTVAANDAGEFYAGGGIYSSAKNVLLQNSLVIQNVAGTGSDVRRTSGSLSAYNTLSTFTAWTDSADCPEYDPSLPLFEQGTSDHYALAEDAQAINVGNNTFIEGYETDLAGNARVAGGIVDLGAYEYPLPDPEPTRLETPILLTGSGNNFVSAGANRHRLTWTEVENASGYEVICSVGGKLRHRLTTRETSALITGLSYGEEVVYNIRALGEGLFTDSSWSGDAPFYVCPIDINGDGDITQTDRAFLVSVWLSEEEDDNFLPFCDINADGNITLVDRAFLVSNWLAETENVAVYPPPLAAELPPRRSDFNSAD
ncbi:MAG: hypothetical protein J6S40_07295 [Thermoguttaceae bacterium]|nr:hypothetical protein [Thermoguttaceae bacterium]